MDLLEINEKIRQREARLTQAGLKIEPLTWKERFDGGGNKISDEAKALGILYELSDEGLLIQKNPDSTKNHFIVDGTKDDAQSYHEGVIIKYLIPV